MFYQNRFTERARQALTLAQEAAASFGHSYIGSEHLLLGLLREGGGPAAKALTAAGVTDEALVHQIEELSGRGTPDSTAPQGMTPRTKRIVELSVQSANEMGTSYVGTEHLLLGILREGQNVALTALANLKITPQILVEKLNEALGGVQDGVSGEPGTAANGGADSKDALSQFGRDLTAAAKEGKLDPVIGRSKEIQRVIQILSRRTKNNPALIGEPPLFVVGADDAVPAGQVRYADYVADQPENDQRSAERCSARPGTRFCAEICRQSARFPADRDSVHRYPDRHGCRADPGSPENL